MTDYLEVNRANWDERAAPHASSPEYARQRFVADPTYLSDVVRFDLPRLGDIRGLDAVHLQCHIGTDTLSLARLGARMTGVDFSASALREARALADECATAIDYVESDVYEAPRALSGRTFDLVFTGIGALCWLPDITRWAGVVAQLLRPGGRLFVRDAHPLLNSLGEHDEGLIIDHPYFETTEPLVWDEPGTYVTTDVAFTSTVTHAWNHGLGEIFTALTTAGLQVLALEEHDTVPWDALPGQMQRGDDGEYRLADRPERLAASFTLQAQQPERV